jgi:hypothetical protein
LPQVLPHVCNTPNEPMSAASSSGASIASNCGSSHLAPSSASLDQRSETSVSHQTRWKPAATDNGSRGTLDSDGHDRWFVHGLLIGFFVFLVASACTRNERFIHSTKSEKAQKEQKQPRSVQPVYTKAAGEQLEVAHPGNPGLGGVSISQLSAPPTHPMAHRKNAVVVSAGAFHWDRPETWSASLDRSPCGTGTLHLPPVIRTGR